MRDRLFPEDETTANHRDEAAEVFPVRCNGSTLTITRRCSQPGRHVARFYNKADESSRYSNYMEINYETRSRSTVRTREDVTDVKYETSFQRGDILNACPTHGE